MPQFTIVPLGLRQDKCLGTCELRKDWLIPPTNNTITATNSKLPINIEPQEQEQPTLSATAAQKQNDVDGDQTVPFART